MTVINTTNSVRETGNAVKVAFDYSFKMFETDEFQVFKIDTSVTPEVSTLQVLGVDYTASILSATEGGTITYIVAPLATEDSFISRLMDLDQPTDIPREANFPEESIEGEFDRSRMIDIQQQADIDLKIGFAVTSSTTGVTFPEPSANSIIGWNAAGTDLTNDPPFAAQVQVDVLATADFIGATNADGVLRTSGLLTYTDGGDFITIGITNALIDHNQLTNFLPAEHFTMLDEDNMASNSATQAATQQSIVAYIATQIATQDTFIEHSDTPAAYAGNALEILRVNAGATAVEFITTATLEVLLDHDLLLNFVANEHIDHTGVSILTAVNTSGLAGGGTIAANRNLVVDIANTTAGTVASLDEVLIADVDDSDNLKRVTAQSIADLGAGGSPIEVFDEGGSLTAAAISFDFVGAGVVASVIGSAITVTVAGGGGGATLTEDITQTTHGFSVNDWVYHNGTIYALADASAAATAESIGVVSAVAGANDFTIQFGGRITGLTGLTAGEAHFLSETPGAITATAPSTEDSVIKPVLIADSTTTGFIFNMRGIAVTSTTSFFQGFVDGAGLTPSFAHNLGHKYCIVQVYDNNDDLIQPDDITLTDANNLVVDLTSYGTRTGTWNVVILDIGSTQSSAASDLSLTGQVAEDFAIFDGTNWLPKGGTEKIKMIASSRNLSTATGTVAYTGLGFKPSYIRVTGCVNTTITFGTGYTDLTSKGSFYQGSANSWQRGVGGGSDCITAFVSAGNSVAGNIDSFDADGFTITWTRTGAPSGTWNFGAECFR